MKANSSSFFRGLIAFKQQNEENLQEKSNIKRNSNFRLVFSKKFTSIHSNLSKEKEHKENNSIKLPEILTIKQKGSTKTKQLNHYASIDILPTPTLKRCEITPQLEQLLHTCKRITSKLLRDKEDCMHIADSIITKANNDFSMNANQTLEEVKRIIKEEYEKEQRSQKNNNIRAHRLTTIKAPEIEELLGAEAKNRKSLENLNRCHTNNDVLIPDFHHITSLYLHDKNMAEESSKKLKKESNKTQLSQIHV